MKTLIFFLILGCFPVFAEDANQSQIVICVHPEDKKLGHMTSSKLCRSVPGHSGIFNPEQTHIDLCADCKTQHPASPDQCKTTPLECRKQRPESD